MLNCITYKINISCVVKNILWHMSYKRRNNQYSSCIICSIYFYMVHENMYNYSQLYLHNLVKIIWAKHRTNDMCKQKLIEYWFFDLQNFPCSMPLERRKTSNPTTEESQTGAFSLQQKIGFRKLQVQFFHLSQIIRINIMNLINTFKTCQNVSRCVNMLWEKNKSKKTSNRINLQVGSLPELSRRLLREDQMARGEFEFASTLGNWKTKCH